MLNTQKCNGKRFTRIPSPCLIDDATGAILSSSSFFDVLFNESKIHQVLTICGAFAGTARE